MGKRISIEKRKREMRIEEMKKKKEEKSMKKEFFQ